MSSFVGYGSYGNMYGYINGAGAAVGMPAGSNNQNAFYLGATANYLTDATMGRRGVAVYSNLSSVGVGALFSVRLNVPGAILSGARVGPMCAFFPNSTGRTYGAPAIVPGVRPY